MVERDGLHVMNRTTSLSPAGRRFPVTTVASSSAASLTYPPPLEIDADNKMYVLVDDGPPEQWHYVFIPSDNTTR